MSNLTVPLSLVPVNEQSHSSIITGTSKWAISRFHYQSKYTSWIKNTTAPHCWNESQKMVCVCVCMCVCVCVCMCWAVHFWDKKEELVYPVPLKNNSCLFLSLTTYLSNIMVSPTQTLSQINSQEIIGHLKQHFTTSLLTYVTNGIQDVKCCIKCWVHLELWPNNMIFVGLQPKRTLGLQSKRTLDRQTICPCCWMCRSHKWYIILGWWKLGWWNAWKKVKQQKWMLSMLLVELVYKPNAHRLQHKHVWCARSDTSFQSSALDSTMCSSISYRALLKPLFKLLLPNALD